MPQFDFYAFSSQVFWSITLFFAFYFVFTQIFLPKIAEVLKLREKRKSLKKQTENITLFSLLLLYLI
jgi:F0F1-type ATP synthase membrane subunit b/b'